MKTKSIYPKEWSEWHPYKKTTDVDAYYADFATDLYGFLADIQIQSELFELDNDTREFCICLTAWFEDIISGTGIWQAFTSECKRLYGSYLPFYQLDDNYFPDEINEEDVRFLLWHHVQQTRKNQIIHPEDPFIADVARELYLFLSDDYEIAPENEQMQAYFSPDRIFEDFHDYRIFLEWFHYNCYFNAFNHIELAIAGDKILKDKSIKDEHIDIMLYTTENELAFKSRNNFLSLTSPEWLARIFANSPQAEILRNVKKEEFSYFKIVSEDAEYLIADDLCYDVKGLRIMKRSLNQKLIPEVGEIISCLLIRYNNVYWQSGIIVHYKENTVLHKIEQSRMEIATLNKSKEGAPAIYKRFMEVNEGRPIAYFNSISEMKEFVSKKLDFHWKTELPISNNHKIAITVSPKVGLGLILDYIECIKDPVNPFFDEKKADKDAIALYVVRGRLPFEIVCMLKDNDFLPNAYLNSSKGKEAGVKFVNDNWDFIVRYFLKSCKEKDLAE